jgi:hypothetical protein
LEIASRSFFCITQQYSTKKSHFLYFFPLLLLYRTKHKEKMAGSKTNPHTLLGDDDDEEWKDLVSTHHSSAVAAAEAAAAAVTGPTTPSASVTSRQQQSTPGSVQLQQPNTLVSGPLGEFSADSPYVPVDLSDNIFNKRHPRWTIFVIAAASIFCALIVLLWIFVWFLNDN